MNYPPILKQLDAGSELLTVEVSREIGAGKESICDEVLLLGFGKDASKIRVLVFAQQHGNEQSGKEGALLLARELLKPENRYLFDRIDLLLVPQMNPDGAEANKRRNGNDADLNRNHLDSYRAGNQCICIVSSTSIFLK